jgi:hypothetical protein
MEMRKLTRIATTLFIVFLVLGLHSHVMAEVPEKQKHEVDHLLDFIKASPCPMERNGKRYTGIEAAGHIEFKYDYFRDEILSTEDFIRLAATKSEMSGKFYLIHCAGEDTRKIGDWLTEELNRYRKFYIHNNARKIQDINQ